jgi:hypothetical protein
MHHRHYLICLQFCGVVLVVPSFVGHGCMGHGLCAGGMVKLGNKVVIMLMGRNVNLITLLLLRKKSLNKIMMASDEVP